MKTVVAALLVVTAGMAVAGQSTVDPKLLAQLKRLFPSATSFSPKEGDPPHFNAYASQPKSGAPQVAGFAFWTTDLEPLERGYEGPIKILVGLDTMGILTGIIVVDHHEPYGSFSIDPPEFAAQFKGKNIRDPFKVGDDIDAVSRASMSVLGATRAVKNSARRVARRLLAPPPR
jgi:NosR/NirI family nitrous oxide reductase transcriptional regulator